VDRRTVYIAAARAEACLTRVQTKLDAVDAVLYRRRLDKRPDLVGSAPFLEGMSRWFRLTTRRHTQMPVTPSPTLRRPEQRADRLILRRAMDEGLIRPTPNDGPCPLHQIITRLAKQFDGHDPPAPRTIAVRPLLLTASPQRCGRTDTGSHRSAIGSSCRAVGGVPHGQGA